VDGVAYLAAGDAARRVRRTILDSIVEPPNSHGLSGILKEHATRVPFKVQEFKFEVGCGR
jgi:hypothetical protein